jgi:hypothetical protein
MAQSQARRYTNIAQDEFEEFLDDFAQFEEVDMDDVNEVVYSIDLPTDDLELRVFSTLQNGSARDRGDDAIRNVVWSLEDDRPVSGRRKTLRIESWRSNLRPKIQDMALNWREAINPRCDECEAWMARRESEHGEFWGCSNYPNCRHTIDI